MINRGALFHELQRSPLICRDITYGDKALREVGATIAARQPGHWLGVEDVLGIGDGDEARGARGPVDAVD